MPRTRLHTYKVYLLVYSNELQKWPDQENEKQVYTTCAKSLLRHFKVLVRIVTGRCTSFASRNSKSCLKKGMFCIARHAKHFGNTSLITYGTNQREFILLTGCWKRRTPKKAPAVPHSKRKIGPFLRNFWVTLTFAGSFVSNTLG